MKHRSSQILYGHWRDRRANSAAPERSDIDPAAIRGALADTFILGFNPLTEHPFRLAGTRVCALFGRELKGSAFTALWDDAGTPPITSLTGAAADESVGVVAGVTGATVDGRSVDLELLLLPLRHCGQTHLRMIGSLAPMLSPSWLGGDRIQSLRLGDYRYVGHERRTSERPMSPARFDLRGALTSGRVRHGLVVIDGGQA